ncbi:cytochrome P450 [Mycobacterium persicum]|uniref:cytochrome P450 n=1 Tax=Mycobacterium persicum TaxID=1487726 RepID=UPI000C08C326|nr:cytochrome P450 [Mycobacterium persicum]
MRLPPEGRGSAWPASPTVGLATGLRSVRAGLDPETYFRRQSDRPDPFVVIFPGLGRVHFFTTAEDSRRILTMPREALCAPTPNPIESIVGPNSVILTSGEQHGCQRRLLSPAFQGAPMRRRADTMATAVLTEITDWRPGDRVPLHRTARKITLRIIIETVLGLRHDRADEFAHVVTELMNANTAPLMLLPALRRNLAGLGPWARLERLRTQFETLVSAQLEHDRRCPCATNGSVLSQLLHETEGESAPVNDQDLQQQLRTMMIAGHDTTAAALAWALYHLHRDTDVRARLAEELSTDPAPHEMPRLPYLSAVIKETLRMHPAVPIILRTLVEPRSVGRMQFSAGDTVGIAIPAIHFSHDLWHDPYRFNPDRFFDSKPTPFAYLPFGGGHRRCLGAAFAHDELAIAIGTMMRTVALIMPRRERRRSPPRSIPRGIAVIPRREIKLVVTGGAGAWPGHPAVS